MPQGGARLCPETLASGGTLAKENAQARQEAAAIRSEIESVQERIANADESVSSSSRRRTSSEKVHEEIFGECGTGRCHCLGRQGWWFAHRAFRSATTPNIVPTPEVSLHRIIDDYMTSQPEIARVKLDHKSLQTAAETQDAEQE